MQSQSEIKTGGSKIATESAEIIQDILECFSLFDKNRTGKMASKYFESASRALGIFLTPSEVKVVLETIEKKDEIDFENFCEFALTKIAETDEFDQLKRAFSVFDPDNEGIVPTDRFKRWMINLGDRLSEQEAKELANLGDASGKGVIVYEDLIALLLSEK